MEFLSQAIEAGLITFACPACSRSGFQESGLSYGLFHCEHCFSLIPSAQWVKKIERKGDDDPFITLRMERNETGIVVQVDITRRGDENRESIRFCSGGGGPKSIHTTHALTQILLNLESGRRPTARLRGVGGILKIYQGSGDADVWMKTKNIEKEEFYGTKVGFPTGHPAIPNLERLLSAMIKDHGDFRPL